LGKTIKLNAHNETNEKMTIKYLVWLDILGFENLANEIAGKTNLDARKVRNDFINVISNKIKEGEEAGEVMGQNYGNNDEWLIVVNSIESVYQIIYRILNHNTGYKEYDKIPIEIAIGLGEYDKWAKFQGSELVIEDSTIDFLKTYLLAQYHSWYKQKYLHSVRDSFVILTSAVFAQLNFYDQQPCQKIDIEKKTTMTGRQSVIYHVSVSAILRKGLFLKFLQTINKKPDSIYRLIDSIFVPPNDYQKILEVLETRRIAFLIGDPEIGKTYTALRILWEYYQKGRQPICYSGAEFTERRAIRRVMAECNIPVNSVIYFEDPFGKIRFEDREDLRRQIGSFLDRVLSSNSIAIISSREEIFRQFEREKISNDSLDAFTVEMLLMKPSYSPAKMDSILSLWAREFGCVWLENESAHAIIRQAIEYLRTPLSLRDFALASKNCRELADVIPLINKKAIDMKQAFAEEISTLPDAKKLFLDLVALLAYVPVGILKDTFQSTACQCRIPLQDNEFDDIEKQLTSKINQEEWPWLNETHFEFTHPSYKEGTICSWNRLSDKNLVITIVGCLATNRDSRIKVACARALLENYQEINFKSYAEKIIDTLLGDSEVATRVSVSNYLAEYSSRLPAQYVKKHLPAMSQDRNRNVRRDAIRILNKNFEAFGLEFSTDTIGHGVNDKAAEVRLESANAVASHINCFSPETVAQALEHSKNLQHYDRWPIDTNARDIHRNLRAKINENFLYNTAWAKRAKNLLS
jgi:hypothetical protein